MKIDVPPAETLPALREIERCAGRLFADTPYAFVTEHDPTALEELETGRAAGTLWTSFDSDDPTGFLLAERIAEGLYIHEISVDPLHQQKGIARALIETAATNADGPIWLRTFTDIAWNRALYERMGFTIVPDPPASIADELLAGEAASRLDPATRCNMRRSA
ncbi:MAG: GNAT family N-acetyltransferase [Pacificimonas sp.]